MYSIIKEFMFAAAHRLVLDYPSPCSRLHGHNWKVRVFLESDRVNQDGMLLDFVEISRVVMDRFDHKTVIWSEDPMLLSLKDIGIEVYEVPFNTTAENMARWIAEQFHDCRAVEIEETEHNTARWEIK